MKSAALVFATAGRILTAWIILIVLYLIPMNTQAQTVLDQHQITQAVQQIFIQTDERNWDQVSACFTDPVRLDYSSLSGNEPAELSSQQVVESWQAVLPGFEATQHSLSNFQVSVDGDRATASCYGTAVHYLPNDTDQGDTWTVVGTYDFELAKREGQWKTSAMTFHFKFTEGNTDLPQRAQEIVARSQK